MAQAAIAAEIHQALDVHAGLARQLCFTQIGAVAPFTDLHHSLTAQLIDPTFFGNLDLLHDLGGILLADSMEVRERDQDALVGRDIYTGNTGHEVSPVADPRPAVFLAILGGCPQTRTRCPSPWLSRGPASSEKLSDWIPGLLKDSTWFRQPSLAFSSLFRDLFGGFPGLSGNTGPGTGGSLCGRFFCLLCGRVAPLPGGLGCVFPAFGILV